MPLENQTELDSAFAQTFQDIGIPPRPAILDRIRQEMQRDEPHFKALGQLIAADVGLSAGLIKTANSPFYGYRNKARSAHDALAMLGLKAISRTIAGLSLRGAFPKTQEMERFWDASAHIAELSAWLVGALGVKGMNAADAHTYGLFRDCGLPVLLLRFPHYAATLKAANAEATLPFTAIELQSFPTEHAIVGSLLAQNWWLPQELCLAIRHHHDLSALCDLRVDLPAGTLSMIALSQTAEFLVQQVTGLSDTREWDKLAGFCLGTLGISQADLDPLMNDASAVLREAA